MPSVWPPLFGEYNSRVPHRLDWEMRLWSMFWWLPWVSWADEDWSFDVTWVTSCKEPKRNSRQRPSSSCEQNWQCNQQVANTRRRIMMRSFWKTLFIYLKISRLHVDKTFEGTWSAAQIYQVSPELSWSASGDERTDELYYLWGKNWNQQWVICWQGWCLRILADSSLPFS